MRRRRYWAAWWQWNPSGQFADYGVEAVYPCRRGDCSSFRINDGPRCLGWCNVGGVVVCCQALELGPATGYRLFKTKREAVAHLKEKGLRWGR